MEVRRQRAGLLSLHMAHRHEVSTVSKNLAVHMWFI